MSPRPDSFGRRLLPQPVLTLAIVALWMMLQSDAGGGTLLLGLALGLLIPIFTSVFWPSRLRVFRAGAAVRLVGIVLYDILVANIAVARVVLGNTRNIRPAFVDVPLDMDDAYVATILGSIITLTPGTLTIDIDMDRRIVHIHGLDVPDPAAVIADIKSRYETPLKEIFGC